MKLHHLIFIVGMVGMGYYFGNKYFMPSNSSDGYTQIRSNAEIAQPSQKNASVPIAPVTQRFDSEEATIALFEKAAPSVCFITTKVVQSNYYGRNLEEIPRGSGSGFVWDSLGHIVTNAHVIENSNKAYVTLGDGSTWEAEPIGSELSKDLAVLRIKAPKNKLFPLPIGSSSDLRVGQFAMAIGNPFGLDQTLTTGVVSALGREIKSLTGVAIRGVVQTDAAINPGNSGGPLLDSSGRLIGVNTQIYSPSGASAGIGFSIPVDEVSWVVPELIKYGKIKRPAIGIQLFPQQEAKRYGMKDGAVVYQIVEGGPAEAAGLRGFMRNSNGEVLPGDIIIGIGDLKIASFDDLYLALEKYKIGDTVKVKYLRDDKAKETIVTLTELRND
jgi:S1-C subfamily serine protease